MHRILVAEGTLFIAVLCGSITWAAGAPSTVPEAIERYARDVDVVVKGSRPVSLEPVFEEGISAAAALERDQLEQFDEPTYHKVQSMMVGFAVSREEVVLAAPLPDFFLKLAREKGTSVDQAFFEALKGTYPDGVRPAYDGSQTDYGGCVIFDGKTLTTLYGTWVGFQKSYPERYRRAAQRELTAIEQAVTSTCACGGKDGVVKELEAFSRAYPASRIIDQVASRLQAVKGGASAGIQFYCQAR